MHGEAGGDGVPVFAWAGGEGVDLGDGAVLGLFDPGFEVGAAECADQVGEPVGEVTDSD